MRITYKLTKLLFVFILLVQCHPKGSSEYVIVNNSGFDVKLEGFERISHFEDGKPILKMEFFAENIFIPAHSQYSSTNYYDNANYQRGVFKQMNIDSVSIVFNREKIIEQYCEQPLGFNTCNIERNIMDIENEYVFEEITKDDNRYTYTITEEDYHRAKTITTTNSL